MTNALSRRAFLSRSALIGCSLAASPLLTPISLAATPGENRLVVILLRGGMDGLDVVRPYGDPAYAALRGDAGLNDTDAAIDLDGYFTRCTPLCAPCSPFGSVASSALPMQSQRPTATNVAISTGKTCLRQAELNSATPHRAMAGSTACCKTFPMAQADTAYAIGREQLSVLVGSAKTQRWTPEADMVLSPQAIKLARLIMAEDPAV